MNRLNSDAVASGDKCRAMGGPWTGNGRPDDDGVIHADITTPGWIRRNDFGLRYGRGSFVGQQQGHGVSTMGVEDASGEMHDDDAEKEEEEEDMSDLAFLERHEALAAEERSRWAGVGGGRGTNDGKGGGDNVRKRSRGNVGVRKPLPLFPTPLESWKLVEDARERHMREAGSIRMAEKIVKKRRRALEAVELPVQAFANTEAVLQREQVKLKKALRKVKRERDQLGSSKQRSATIKVLHSAATTLEATEQTFRTNSAEYMKMLKNLASQANTTLTAPISFTSVHKDLVAIRRAAEAAKMEETNMSLGFFVKMALDKKKYPGLIANFYLRDDYRIDGRIHGTGDSRSDGVGSSFAENEVYGIMDDFVETPEGYGVPTPRHPEQSRMSPEMGPASLPPHDPFTPYNAPSNVPMGSPRITLTPSIQQPLSKLSVSDPAPPLTPSHAAGVNLIMGLSEVPAGVSTAQSIEIGQGQVNQPPNPDQTMYRYIPGDATNIERTTGIPKYDSLPIRREEPAPPYAPFNYKPRDDMNMQRTAEVSDGNALSIPETPVAQYEEDGSVKTLPDVEIVESRRKSNTSDEIEILEVKNNNSNKEDQEVVPGRSVTPSDKDTQMQSPSPPP